MSEPSIRVEDLRVVRGGKPALDGISLEVASGIVTGLLGPSGGGKSTLLRSVVGVQRVDSGRVTVLGRPAGSPELRSRVGYRTQAASVYSDLTVRENVHYFGRVLGVPETGVDDAIETVDLVAEAGQLAGRLSGGQLARVALAMALLGEPEVLVLDEPTVGLDPLLRRDLWDMFHAVADRGATILVSSHVMDEADRCDELLLLREGRIIATGTPDALRRRTGADDLDSVFLRLVEGDA
jgi:ABC-2 type transport system ATP-binding protein